MTRQSAQVKEFWGLGIAVVLGAIAGMVSGSPGQATPLEGVKQQSAPLKINPPLPVCNSTGTIAPNHPDVQALKALSQKYKTSIVLAIGNAPIPRCEFAAVLSAVSDQVQTVIRLAPPSPDFPISKETVKVLLRLYKAYDTELAFFPPAHSIVSGDGRAGALETQVLFRSPIRLNRGEGVPMVDEVPIKPADFKKH